ncbi:hypothetical protein [Streptomyces sp. NPDC002671]
MSNIGWLARDHRRGLDGIRETRVEREPLTLLKEREAAARRQWTRPLV